MESCILGVMDDKRQVVLLVVLLVILLGVGLWLGQRLIWSEDSDIDLDSTLEVNEIETEVISAVIEEWGETQSNMKTPGLYSLSEFRDMVRLEINLQVVGGPIYGDGEVMLPVRLGEKKFMLSMGTNETQMLVDAIPMDKDTYTITSYTVSDIVNQSMLRSVIRVRIIMEDSQGVMQDDIDTGVCGGRCKDKVLINQKYMSNNVLLYDYMRGNNDGGCIDDNFVVGPPDQIGYIE